MNRRFFLRGLGGAAVAAPFLGSVVERNAKAADAPTTGGNGKTLIVMFTHYGCLTDRFFPMTDNGPLAAADLKGLTIESLAPFASKLLLPRGVRGMNEWNAGNNKASGARGQGNDPHTQVVGSFFSLQPVTPNSNDPFSFDSATKFNAKPTGPTLDHVCAKQVSPGGAPMFMRVSGNADNGQSGISYSAAETAYPGIGTVEQAFKNITGLTMGSGGGTTAPMMNADSYKALRGKSVLDLIKDDLQTLERMDMSKSDKDKIAAWKALLSDTGKVVASSASCSKDLATMLGLTDAAVKSTSKDITAKLSGSTLDQADLFSNIAVLAAVCKSNPVIFLKYPGNYTMKALGITVENHSVSHRIGNANMGGTCIEGVNGMIEKMDKYNAEKFAYLLGKLDGIKEGDGTVLDNLVATWIQEMSDGNAHNLNNLPIIQAGSAGGRFKTGQSIKLDPMGDSKLQRGNSVGPCETAGKVTATNTATDPKYGNAPINKYYCNLMNAIGVKAGTDGFPATGGTAEVTHFGKFDNTADFFDGLTKTAKISSPGEFKELLAKA